MAWSLSATVAGEPTSQLCRAQYSGVTSESGTSGLCFRNSVNWNDARSGRKYSCIIRPSMPPAESRIASASVSAMKISRTRRQSARLGVRPLRAAPSSTDSQWLATYAGLRFRLIGQKPRSPASLSVSEPLLTPATPIGGGGLFHRRGGGRPPARHPAPLLSRPELLLFFE